jgi:putative transposase
MSARKRKGVRPTHEWELLLPLFEWPEQEEYEAIRPLVLFDASVAERAREVGSSASTLYRRLNRFEEEGMEGLFDAPTAKRRKLPPAVRRLILDLKAEYPRFNLNEIANVVHACFGRRPDYRSVRRVLDEEPLPLKMVRRYPPYHEMEDAREGRAAIVELRLDGWSAKAIAGYLGVHRATVHRTLERWKKAGVEGLGDRPHGRPPGVRKADFAAVEEIRKLARNPNLGAFRVHAALKQMGFDLSRATCGRILAQVREVYGYEKPEPGGGAKKAMPFAASRRHEFWSADVRHLDMVDEGRFGGKVYVVAVMDNYSRAILSSAVTRRQDLSAFLSVLYRAVELYGAPEAFVTDSGSVFLANRAKAIYRALGVRKEEIEKGEPWQNYSETMFNVQRRMADWHFRRAKNWPDLVAAHERWTADYNGQAHFAHERRKDGRRSPEEVLGWVAGVRFRPKDLERAFFSTRFARKLDASGYATLMRWRLYGEEGLAAKEAALWLQDETLTVEYGGETLSRYEVEYLPETGKLREVGRPTLFETSFASKRPRLFELDALGEGGWLKALRLEDYSRRRPRRPMALQQVLFPYGEAWG